MIKPTKRWPNIKKQPQIIMGGLLAGITLIVITMHFNTPIGDNKPATFDVRMTNTRYHWTNAEGEFRGELTAQETKYNTKTNVVFMKKPQLITTDNRQHKWVIHSDYGKSIQNNKVVHLWGHVIITQTIPHATSPTIITTHTITLLPYQEKAYTNDQVTMIQQNSKIESKGFTIDMKQGTIHLLSHARGQYDPI